MSTNETTGLFSSTFSEPIIVKPYSKISLVNASLNLNDENIVINSGNNTISYQMKHDGTTYHATIPSGSYNQSSLVDALNQALNSVISNQTETGQYLGFRWRVVYHSNTKLLSFNFGRSEGVYLQDNLKNIVYDSGTQKLTSTHSSTNSNFVSFSYSDNVVTTGAGSIVCKITDSVDNVTNVNGIFGLLMEKPSSTATTLNADQYKVGIRVASNADLYIIIDGVETDTGLFITVTKSMFIRFNLGTVEFGLIAPDATETLIHTNEINLPYNVEGYHCAVSLRAQSATARCLYLPDPFSSAKMLYADAVVPKFPLPQVTHEAVGLTTVYASNVTLSMSERTREVLGFGFLAQTKTAVSGSFLTLESLVSANVPASITVEVPTFPTMESFDSLSQKRRPIVSVIPSLIQTDNKLVYDSKYPVWVHLNNSYSYSVSKLDVRLLDSSTDSEIKMNECCLTFNIISNC